MTGDGARMAEDRVGYVVSAYPAVSHAFIQREVVALRETGRRVDVFSVHRADPSVVLSQQDEQELAHTTSILPVAPGKVVAAHVRAFARAPRAYLSTLRYALAQSPRGMRARLWQLFYFAEAILVWHECDARGIRHLHAHFANVGADVAWLASAFGAHADPRGGWRWTFTMHGCVEFWSVDRFNLVRKVAAADRVLCISEYTRAQLMALCDPDDWAKLDVVHCGVDVTQYRPAAVAPRAAGPVRIVAVGRLSHEKGHPVLIRAFARLRARGLDVQLTLIGDGPFRDRLTELARSLGVDDALSFEGAVGQDDLPAHLQRADVFCQPSFAEGIPVVLMEAMASGLPVVSSAVAGIPELVEHGSTGLLVPPGRADLLADALAALVEDPARRREMGRAGRAVVEHSFDIGQVAQQIAERFRPRDLVGVAAGALVHAAPAAVASSEEAHDGQ
jgi:glycosyltransferase involved in cell wall biosynthesis